MKKFANGICNVVFGVLSLVYFLIQIDTIRIPGTVENGRYTESFQTVFTAFQIVLALLGLALAVYNVKKSKEYEKVAKWGCNISTVCAVANSCFLLVNGKMSIFCILGLVASVLLIAGVVKE